MRLPLVRQSVVASAVSALLISGLSGCSSSPTRKELSRTEKATLFVNVANGALMEGDPTSALIALREAEAADPTLWEIHLSRALAFSAKKDLAAATKSARIAVKMRPDSSTARNTLGKFLLDQGQSSEAVEHLMKAATDPYNAEAFKAQTNLGILFYRKGDHSRAIQHFDKAIEAAPMGSCHAHYYLGHIHLRDGKFDKAIREYSKAGAGPCARFPDAQFALGIAYERTKRFDEARKIYLSLRTSFPRSQFAEKAMDRLRDIP